MKKIVFFVLLVLFSGTSFAVNYENLINSYLSRFDNRLHKAFSPLEVYCKKAPLYYDKLLVVLKKYYLKYPRYKSFFHLFIQKTESKKKLEIINCQSVLQIQKELEERLNNPSKFKKTKPINYIKLRGDFFLKSVINKAFLNSLDKNVELNSNINYIKQFPSGKVLPLQDIYGIFIKVNNRWYRLTRYSYIDASSSVVKNIVSQANYYLSKYKKDYLFYNKSKVLLVNKNDLIDLDGMNPRLSSKENLKILEKKGLLVLDKFYGEFTSGSNIKIPSRGIFEYKGNLFGFSFSDKFSYYPGGDANINVLADIVLDKKFTVVFVLNDKFYFFRPADIRFFYLGDKRLYGNINLNRLSKILSSSFYYIARGYYNYSPTDMKNLILFSLDFNNKKLSDLFKYMLSNFRYNRQIGDFINKNSSNLDLNGYLKSHPDLMKNWVDFYTLKSKEGVCETFSDIFSLVALFNGGDADIVEGISRNNPHQVSKVNNYYYDITYGLGGKSWSYFGMTLKDLDKYFKIKNS